MTEINDSTTFDAQSVIMTKTHPTDAKFWPRAYANLLDGIIISFLFIPVVILSGIFFIFNKDLFNHFWQVSQQILANSYWYAGALFGGIYFILTAFVSIIYNCYYLSSDDQATPGMKLHGLKLVNSQGNSVSFPQVFLREIISIVSFFGFFIGYLMALFTKRRQALHDMLTSTYVQDHLDDSNTEILISQNYQNYSFAGFWRRLGAYSIDSVIVVIFYIGLSISILLSDNINANKNLSVEPDIIRVILLGTVEYFIPLFYWIFFTSSRFQATPGKMLLSLKVVDNKGDRLTFVKSSIRYFSEVFYSFIFGIGFIMAAFTKRKQGLHDKIALTYVIHVPKKAKDKIIKSDL